MTATRRVALVIVVAFTGVGCAPAVAPPPRAATAEAPPPKRLQNRPPKSFCAHELVTLKDEVGMGFVSLEDAASPSPKDPAKLVRPFPRRRVVVQNRLPPSYVIEGLVFPSTTAQVRIEGAPSGTIAEIDGRGARGPVAVILRRKRTGGLYDYVGDCQVVRNDIEVLPWNPRVPLPKTIEDVVVVLDMIDNRPIVRVEGVPVGEGIRPTDLMMRF